MRRGDGCLAAVVPVLIDRPWGGKSAFVASIGPDRPLHPDYGTTWQGAPSGIPYVVVGPDQPRVPVRFEYAAESDPGPYPIPLDAPVEGGPQGMGDRHVIVIDAGARKLYETFAAHRDGAGFRAGSGAVFDLTSNATTFLKRGFPARRSS